MAYNYRDTTRDELDTLIAAVGIKAHALGPTSESVYDLNDGRVFVVFTRYATRVTERLPGDVYFPTCSWGATSADECATMRERSVAGKSDTIPTCTIHGGE